MRTKSAYRENKSESENKPAVEAAIAPSPEAPAVAVDVRPESEPQPQPQPQAVREHEKQISEADEGATALKRQIEALRESEALNRHAAQQAARLQQRPLTREEKLAAWKAQGMPSDQLAFLEANPQMVDYSDLAAFAANEAAQAGHERGSREHMHATKQIFDQHMEHLKQQATANNPESAMTPTPKFFPRHVPVSAPVSRQIPDGSPRPEYEQDPRRVHLSVEEREIARASGITEVQYAANKIKLMQAKARGEIV
jgi:hypothetical protein